MPRSSDTPHARPRNREPRVILRGIAIALAAANLVAIFLVFRPVGGSKEELERQLAETRLQLGQRRVALQRMKAVTTKVEAGGDQGDQFINDYFLNRRTAYSTLVSELHEAAKKAGMKPREHAFNEEMIEGSDTLGVLTITAGYEGSYADLLQFVHALDRSPRLLVIENLQASPQQTAGTLNVSMRLDAFTREEGGR